jgi:hypothetical protein
MSPLLWVSTFMSYLTGSALLSTKSSGFAGTETWEELNFVARFQLQASPADTRGLSIEEDIPWKCRRLVVCTGTGALPIMDEVKCEADRRENELVILPTADAIKTLQEKLDKTNAILQRPPASDPA